MHGCSCQLHLTEGNIVRNYSKNTTTEIQKEKKNTKMFKKMLRNIVRKKGCGFF